MSEVNANITVNPISLTVTPTNNQITITPADIQLGIYTAGQGTPGAAGNLGQLQFNNLGVLAGAANTQVTANGNVRFQNIGNLKINGGSNAYFLQTDGTGNLTWAPGTSNVSGSGTSAGANTQIQISDGSGNFTSGPGFTFDNVSNVLTVPGNAYASNFIGTLANGNSNITMATSNGNIEFYVNGNTSTKITDNQLETSNLKLTSNNIALGNGAGGISQGPFGIGIGPNAGGNLQAFCGVAIGVGAASYNQGQLAVAIGLDAGGNSQGINSIAIGPGAGTETLGNYSIAIGNGAGSLTSGNNSIIINAANAAFQGPLSNAFYVNPIRNANTANVLFYNNSTGEITYGLKPASDGISNGTSNISIPVTNGNVLIGVAGNANVLTVTGTGANIIGTANITSTANIGGNLTAANANLGNLVTANFYTGNGSLLTGIVAVGGNANYANFAGTVITNAQPNITSVGTLTDLRVNNQNIVLGSGANTGNTAVVTIGWYSNTYNANYSVALGSNATTYNSAYSVAVGKEAIASNTYTTAVGSYSYAKYANSVALGYAAAAHGVESIAIGYRAGFNNTGYNIPRTIFIGPYAGNASGNSGGIAIGPFAGDLNHGDDAVALGNRAGTTTQGSRAVAIGSYAGSNNQGNSSIAIGAFAGKTTQHANTIIISSIGTLGSELNSTQANSLFVKPIRDVTGNAAFTVQLYYNPTTGEIGYK